MMIYEKSFESIYFEMMTSYIISL